MKHTRHENKGNDHQTWNVLKFNQILPTSNKKYMENSKGNMRVDIGA